MRGAVWIKIKRVSGKLFKHVPGKPLQVLMVDLLLILMSLFAIYLLIQGVVNATPGEDNSAQFSIVALLIAIVSILFTARTWASDQRARKSGAYTVRIIKGWREAAEILNKAGPDRAKWLAAARIISACNILRKEVSEQPDKDTLEIEIALIREELWDCLEHPGSYYLGYPEISKLTDAIEKHKKKGVVCEIPVNALYVIYDLIKYPDGYKDPMTYRSNFSKDDFKNLGRDSSGLLDYVTSC